MDEPIDIKHPHKSLLLTLTQCQRCGGSHKDLRFKPFRHGDAKFTHWAVCPNTGEPLLSASAAADAADAENAGQFQIGWLSIKGTASIPVDPNYPMGRTIKADQEGPFCTAKVTYPAKGVGRISVRCKRCGAFRSAIAGGNTSDPARIELTCKNKHNE